MDINEIMDHLICIGDDTLYYRDANDQVQLTPIGNRARFYEEGYDATDLMDGIRDKTILNDVKSFGRSSPTYNMTNLTHLQDLCVSRLGQDFEMIANEYHRWLVNVSRRTTADGNKPPKDPSEMTETDKRKLLDAARDKRIADEFGSNVRYFRGLTLTSKETIEIQYCLNAKVLKTPADRHNWVHDNAYKLARVGFEEIAKDPHYRRKLSKDFRYFPNNVTITTTGDVFIEFNAKNVESLKHEK